MRRIPRLAGPALVLLLLAACAGTKPDAIGDVRPTPIRFKAIYAAPENAASLPADGNWWKVFGDPRLDALVSRASQSSTSVQVAVANLAKARAQVRNSDAARLPRLGLSGGGDVQKGPLVNSAGSSGTLWTASASLSYELDIMGRLSRDSEAAALDVESREALLRSTRLMVQAEVTDHYLELQSLGSERMLLEKVLDSQRSTLRVAERRFALGAVAELDVVRLQAELASAESDTFALERRQGELVNALAVLVGAFASDFDLPRGDAASMPGTPATLPGIPAGIPASVLERRPDVRAARQSMLAAQTRLGITQDAWLPNITLNMTQGFASPTLGDLIAMSSRAWGVSALLSLPLFDGGRRQAAEQGARADLDIALAKYTEQVLVAVREVEDQLAALRILNAQQNVQQRAVAAGARTRVLASSRYDRGLSSQLELLDAQRGELRIQRQALQVHTAQLQATVALIRALGGGWTP